MANLPPGYMPPDMVQRVLASAGEDVVLVGGQALAFWADRYGVSAPPRMPAISRDVDFFTRSSSNTDPVKRFANAIGGTAEIDGQA
jgi:hypothetical protein